MIKDDVAWPMANYLPAWRTFRRLGDEPRTTAECVIQQPGWPTQDGLRILDIGCGDGRMLEAFLLAARQKTSRVILLDPDDHMLSEAVIEIGELGLGCVIDPQVGMAVEEGLKLAKDVDVGLAIHVVYLLPHSRFRHFIERWPSGVPLFVVLDSPDSVFTELWRQTAPEYAMRSMSVHKFFSGEIAEALAVRKVSFTTRVANPFALGEAARNLVLSMLCYCDIGDLKPNVMQEVERVVHRHLDGDFLTCLCTCYEIIRR